MPSRSLASNSKPSVLANSSSIVTAPGASTAFAVTAKVASLPATAAAAIVVGKLDIEGLVFARLDARQVLLEAGDELPGTQDHGDVLAGAAGERLALDLALKDDRDPVAFCRAFGLGANGRFCSAIRCSVLSISAVGHLGDRASSLIALEIGERDRRQQSRSRRYRRDPPCRDDLLDRALLLGQRHLGFDREPDSRDR